MNDVPSTRATVRVAVIAALLAALSLGQPCFSQEQSGTDLLGEAMDLKLSLAQQRYSFRDLERVVALCESALEAGLDEGSEEFAKSLLSGTFYEQAQMVIAPVLEGQLDASWRRRRSMALEAIREAIDYAPEDGESHLLLARILALPGGDATEGLEAGNQAVELLADNPARKSLALLARAVFQETNELRLADYDAAVQIGEGNLDAYRERGRARLIVGDLEAAVADFQHVLDEDDADRETIELLTQALIAQDKFDEAIQQASLLVDSDPEGVDGLMLRASLYVSKGDFDNAVGDLNASLKRDPTNVDALLGRAAVRDATSDYDEALADVDRALELRPGLPRALLLRSQIASSAGDLSQAIRDLRQLSRADPSNLGIKMQLAITYLSNDQPELAIGQYDAVLKNDAEVWQAVRGRGDAYLGVGKHAEAVADYALAFEQEEMREDPGLLNNFAWVLATSPDADVRDGKQALDLAKKACEVTEYEASHILSTLAAAYAELGDFEKAIEWSSKAVELEAEVEELKAQLAEELESYRAGEPWRELKDSSVNESAAVAEDDLFVDEAQDAVESSESVKID